MSPLDFFIAALQGSEVLPRRQRMVRALSRSSRMSSKFEMYSLHVVRNSASTLIHSISPSHREPFCSMNPSRRNLKACRAVVACAVVACAVVACAVLTGHSTVTDTVTATAAADSPMGVCTAPTPSESVSDTPTLESLMQLIVTLSETTNKRLDEALGAVNKRLDDTTKRLDDMKNDMRARVNHVYDLIVNEHAMPTLRAEYVHVIMPALAASRAGRR